MFYKIPVTAFLECSETVEAVLLYDGVADNIRGADITFWDVSWMDCYFKLILIVQFFVTESSEHTRRILFM